MPTLTALARRDIQKAAVEFKEFQYVNEQFQKLSKCMETIRTVAEDRLKAAQLRIGITSLPNELLTLILHLTIQCEDTPTPDSSPLRRSS